MSRQKAAKEISILLDRLFPNPAIPLTHTNPFTLLVAVILSAHSSDARVNQVTPHLFKLADTPDAMGLLDEKQIAAVIRTCGLGNTKARAIRQLSLDLVKHHARKVPSSFEELEKLPGVGHKTASVVMAQAFHIPAFPVDTHIFRCAHRWGLSKGKTPTLVEKDLKQLFPKNRWMKLHLQIIYFARAYCPARGHKKEHCPICSSLKKWEKLE